jgi:hypothetical protein
MATQGACQRPVGPQQGPDAEERQEAGCPRWIRSGMSVLCGVVPGPEPGETAEDPQESLKDVSGR